MQATETPDGEDFDLVVVPLSWCEATFGSRLAGAGVDMAVGLGVRVRLQGSDGCVQAVHFTAADGSMCRAARLECGDATGVLAAASDAASREWVVVVPSRGDGEDGERYLVLEMVEQAAAVIG